VKIEVLEKVEQNYALEELQKTEALEESERIEALGECEMQSEYASAILARIEDRVRRALWGH